MSFSIREFALGNFCVAAFDTFKDSSGMKLLEFLYAQTVPELALPIARI